MGRAKKPPTRRAAQRAPQTEFPVKDMDRLFCERWLIHFDAQKAYAEAGFAQTTGTRTRALGKLTQFAEYLRPIREAKAKIMAERLAVTTEGVIAKMQEKAFFDAGDYLERGLKPLTQITKKKRKDGGVDEVEETVMWEGKAVYAERLKPYADLTAEQRAVVEITSTAGDRIQYRLPTLREQHMYLTSVGRQMGLFAEKLILERHNHEHRHATLSFDNVPTAQLTGARQALIPLAGAEFAKSLGFTDAEIAALLPDKASA